jgi:hypothetical protein
MGSRQVDGWVGCGALTSCLEGRAWGECVAGWLSVQHSRVEGARELEAGSHTCVSKPS